MSNTRHSNADATDLFLSELSGVAPIKQDKVVLAPAPLTPTEAQLARRESAARALLRDENHLTEEYVEMLDPDDVLSFQRPGVQHGVFRKLRLGQYPSEATLDLHRMTVKDARHEVFQFIRDAIRMDIRTLMILHGKGERSNPPALIKSYTARWLTQLDEVMAFHSAQRHHGGTGAVYVLLCKSERKKQENRERHLNRRG